MTEIQKKLIAALRDMFQFDQADLDFGVYRIMSLKRAEIEEFLKEKLPAEITEGLRELAELERSTTSKKRVLEIEKQCAELGVDVSETKLAEEYANLKAELAAGIETAEVERQIYSHLYEFFSRYYDDGDFISQRRYKDGVYAIPYEGEEVKLHWANADQYYVKTSEYFKDYSFKDIHGRTVMFKLLDAVTERDNNKSKEKKFFRLYADNPFIVENNTLTIQIEYKAGDKKQAEYIAEIVAAFRAKAEAETNTFFEFAKLLEEADGKTELERHLNRYTAKNTFDYFIHKDLDGFLNRELDFFIKSEVFYIDDINEQSFAHTRSYITKAKVLRKIAQKIIKFLAQIENFQKKLYLKKKFVVETNYCITLDRVPESFYPEIAASDEQREEWVKLFAIDDIVGDLAAVSYSEPLSEVFLKQNPYLVVDTVFFGVDFKERLIANIDKLDEKLDGLLIHGDNFQALKLLQDKYKAQIDCIHIDPPYNTDTSGFLYKNNYKHSSWLSMMNDRIDDSYSLLSSSGSFVCHIDENEYERLWSLLEIKPFIKTGTIIWDKRNPMTGGGGIATQHEYILWRDKSAKTIEINTDHVQMMLDKAKQLVKKHGCVNEIVRSEYTIWLNAQGFSNGEKAYRYIDDTGNLYQSVSLRAPELRLDPKFHIPLIHPKTGKPCPVPPNGFSRTPETLAAMIERGEILFGEDESTQPRQKSILKPEKVRQLTSVIQDATRGKADLKKLGLDFPYNHSATFYELLVSSAADEYAVTLDYFAGSGTTAHAVINLNRADDGNRKYILCEMGEYFDTVTKPRIQKVIYSDEWKDGKPKTRQGSSHAFKYIRLESYDDALNNIILTDGQQDLLGSALGEQYFLSYMLNNEANGASLLQIDKLSHPFEYTLSIKRQNESKATVVDLCETFNYLIGLTVTKNHAKQSFSAAFTEGRYGAATATLSSGADYILKAIEGTLPNGDTALIVWRTVSGDTQNDNAVLEAFIKASVAGKYKKIYINGDNAIEGAILIEEEMKRRMFEGCE